MIPQRIPSLKLTATAAKVAKGPENGWLEDNYVPFGTYFQGPNCLGLGRVSIINHFHGVGLGAPSWDLKASTGRSAAHGYPAPLAKLVSPKRHLKLINSQPQPPPTTPTLPPTKNNKNLPTNNPTLYAKIKKKNSFTSCVPIFAVRYWAPPKCSIPWGSEGWLIGGTQDLSMATILDLLIYR